MQPASRADDALLLRARRMAQRSRAAAACLPCKANKARCSDYRPCARCKKAGAESLCTDMQSAARFLSTAAGDIQQTSAESGIQVTSTESPVSHSIPVTVGRFENMHYLPDNEISSNFHTVPMPSHQTPQIGHSVAVSNDAHQFSPRFSTTSEAASTYSRMVAMQPWLRTSSDGWRAPYQEEEQVGRP
jgi:hypothetical protein